MKVKIILTVAAIFTLVCFVAKSQVEPVGGDVVGNVKTTLPDAKPTGSTNVYSPSGVGTITDDKNLGEECSMYLDNEWKIAKVELGDNSVLDDLPVRYNIYTQQMQFIQDADTLAFGDPLEISSIKFDERTFIFAPFYCTGQIKQGYFELLCDGDCKLLLHRCIKYRYVEECVDPNNEFVREEYYMGKKYFVYKNEKPAEQFPSKKNDVVELLSDKKVDIKSFIKKNKIKLNQEQDLIKLFSYYNSKL